MSVWLVRKEAEAALEALPTDEGGPVAVTIRQPREDCKDLRDHYLATKAAEGFPRFWYNSNRDLIKKGTPR